MTTDDEQLRQEKFIIDTEISAERKGRFLAQYREDRNKAATLRSLFEGADAFRRVSQRDPKHSFGFATLLRKGPFVEGSNWGEYRTWDFAVACEEYLLSLFEDILLSAPTFGEIPPRAADLACQCRVLIDEAGKVHFTPSAIVICGQLEGNEAVEMQMRHGFTPRYDVPNGIRTPWILGYFAGKPVVYFREAKKPRLYVVDLAQFAELVQYDDVEFELEEIDDPRARELLRQYPQRVKVPEGRPDTEAEKIRQLKLHVALRLSEMYCLQSKDVNAAIGSDLRADES